MSQHTWSLHAVREQRARPDQSKQRGSSTTAAGEQGTSEVGLCQAEAGGAQQGEAQLSVHLLLTQAWQARLGSLQHLLPYLHPPAQK